MKRKRSDVELRNEVYNLYTKEGLTYKELAKKFKVPYANIYNWCHRNLEAHTIEIPPPVAKNNDSIIRLIKIEMETNISFSEVLKKRLTVLEKTLELLLTVP